MSADWLCFACAILLLTTVPLATSTTSKTIVFIAGWPQSGTSMLHKFLSLHPGVSTMMERCVQRHGKKCENWNYEGQWLLSNSTLRQQLHSGSTCPVTKLPHDVQDAIFGEVSLAYLELSIGADRVVCSGMRCGMHQSLFTSKNLHNH